MQKVETYINENKTFIENNNYFIFNELNITSLSPYRIEIKQWYQKQKLYLKKIIKLYFYCKKIRR